MKERMEAVREQNTQRWEKTWPLLGVVGTIMRRDETSQKVTLPVLWLRACLSFSLAISALTLEKRRRGREDTTTMMTKGKWTQT